METMKKGVIRKASLPTRINPVVGFYSTLILMFFPQLGQVIIIPLLLNSSDISTFKAFDILFNVS